MRRFPNAQGREKPRTAVGEKPLRLRPFNPRRHRLIRAYKRLEWFFEKASTGGSHAIPLDPNQWLFKGGIERAELTRDAVADIAVVLRKLKSEGTITETQWLHIWSEFCDKNSDICREKHHHVMIDRACFRIDNAFDATGIYRARHTQRIDAVEIERLPDGWAAIKGGPKCYQMD